jgi:hypothetical protein
MTTTIKDFCIQNNIQWFPIYLELVEGKEGKIEKKLSMIKHPAYEGLPKQTDFGTLTDEQIVARQNILNYKIYSHVKHIAMDTRHFHHIDIDVPDYDETFDEIAETTPYFKSTTKSYGKHILITNSNFTPSTKRQQFRCQGVELLCGQWSYAPIDGVMYNTDKPIVEFTGLSNMLEEEVRTVIKKKKIIKIADSPTTPTTPAPPTTPTMPTPVGDMEKLISCFSVTRATDYNMWLGVMFMIANEMGDAGEQLFLDFSKKSPSFDENNCERMFRAYVYKTNKLKKEQKINIGSGHFWAKVDNPVLYAQHFPKAENVFKNDEECGVYIYGKLKANILCCNNQIFIKIGNIWYNDIEYLRIYLTDYIMKENVYKNTSEDEDKKWMYWKDLKPAKNVVEVVINKIKLHPDNDLYDKFHTTTKGKVCFLDGVLDFVNKKFYLWEEVDFEYYTTVQINYKFKAYFEKPNIKTIDEIKTKIFAPLFGGKMDRALQFFSRAFAGFNEDKNYATYLGNRDCGKGVLFELFEKSFQSYLKEFVLDNILCSRETKTNPETSRGLYWLMDYEFVRLAFSQETPEKSKGLKVNSALFKKLVGGGDKQTARRNYDRVDTSFKVDMTPFMAGNHSLELEGDLKEHLIEFESVVQFKKQDEIDRLHASGVNPLILNSFHVKDDNIKKLCSSTEWKMATIYLIYSNFVNTALTIERGEAEEEGDETILERFCGEYEITNNAENVVPIKELQMKPYGKDWKKLKAGLEGLGLAIKKCNYRNNILKDKMCCFGIKIREIEGEEGEEP